MQVSVKAAGRILLTGALAVLAGCGGADKVKVAPTYYRIQDIRHYTYSGSTATQVSLQHFTYKTSNEPDLVLYYKDKGADGVWGTTDDTPGYYVSCAYSGKAAATPLDIESEVSNGLNALYSGFAASMTGISQSDLARSCTINYNGQGALAMKVFNGPGADGKWQTADDSQLLAIDWQQPGTTGDASVTVSAPTVAGYTATTTAHYYRTSSGGAVKDLVRDGYYQEYLFDVQKRPTRISLYAFGGTGSGWSGPLPSDVRREYMTYDYGASDLLKCRYDLAATPVEAVHDLFVNGLLSERRFFDAGIDLTPCTGDDSAIALESFGFEKL